MKYLKRHKREPRKKYNNNQREEEQTKRREKREIKTGLMMQDAPQHKRRGIFTLEDTICCVGFSLVECRRKQEK